LKFRLEEIDGEPRAAIDGAGRDEEALLQQFLLPAVHFVPDVLYEISLVERLAVESSGFETDLIDVKILPDQVSIKSKLRIEGAGRPTELALPLDEAKLMLLEWGAALQRWWMDRKEAG
jgi:hypothetical protein